MYCKCLTSRLESYVLLLLLCSTGLMITSKKRHEFRIKLQKRARQRVEKRLETIREDNDLLQVSLNFNLLVI